MRKEAAHGSRTTQHAGLREEQLLSVQLDSMGHADIADHRARPRAVNGLVHRFFHAHTFEHRIRADSFGERLDLRHAFIAALGHDVGGAEFGRELLPRFVTAHRNDPRRPHLLCGEHPHETYRPISYDRDGRSGLDARRIRRVPAGAEHIRNRKQMGNQIVRW